MIYLDPYNIGTFYVGYSENLREQLSKFYEQKPAVAEAARNFVIGSKIKVFEGNVLGLEARGSAFDWGKGFEIKGGLEGEKLNASISYEEKVSDYGRVLPSSKKIEVQASYQDGPKWRIDVIGSGTVEKYQEAKSETTYQGKVIFTIFLQ